MTKLGVIIFPGSNCDEDIIYVLETLLGQHVVRLWHKNHDLQGCKLVVLPGGFSFGDYLRSGAIARFSPIMKEVVNFAAKGGAVVGICNGFQILAEAGLVPGALMHNQDRKFISKNIFISARNNNTLMTAAIPDGAVLRLPIAHAEGNYFASQGMLEEMNHNGQVVFTYCDAEGKTSIESNPNGSIHNIAGVCNKTKNVFGLMPHPERACDPNLGNTDGWGVFQSILLQLS